MLDEVGIKAQMFAFFYHRDLMNAQVHGTPVRWSPITVSASALLAASPGTRLDLIGQIGQTAFDRMRQVQDTAYAEPAPAP